LWATWCAGCRAELPDLARLAGEAGKRVVAVSVDVPEERGQAAAVLSREGGAIEGVYLSPALIESLVDVDRLSLPTTLVLDDQGILRRIVRGPLKP